MEKKNENRVTVLRAIACDFEYIQDVPSILTFDRRVLQRTENGELIQNEKEPQWSLRLNCTKQTVFNYGPWFDRQREHLWNYFFPATYEALQPQPEPTLNERRQTSKFELMLNFEDPNTEINVIFAHLSNPASEELPKSSPDEVPKSSNGNERKLVRLSLKN